MGQLIPLDSFGVTEHDVLEALGRVNVRDVDYADLYFESCISESVSMEESLVKRATKSISQGVGVRATAGEKTGFAYSDDLTQTRPRTRRRYGPIYCQLTRRVPTRSSPGPFQADKRSLPGPPRTGGCRHGGPRHALEPHRCGGETLRSSHQKCYGLL